jgi:flavin-dependent dehydrogenase
MKDSTIKIIGAGPAGLSAAINLAKKEYRVIVYEKNPDVGMRFHNDFQGLENWSTDEDVMNLLQSMSIDIEFFNKPFYSGFLYGPSTNAEIKSRKPFFYLVKRGSDQDSLDSSLKKQALELGVHIIFNSALNEQAGDIIATGPKNPKIFAAGITFRTNLKEDIAITILDDSVAPKGYAYLLVSDMRATLATVIFEKVRDYNQCLENTIKRLKEIINFDINSVKKFIGVGSAFIPDSATKEKRLYVGEAAGFQDFLFGFGMRYAVKSGYLAAKSIIENKDYDTLWKENFDNQLQTSLSNRMIYASFGNSVYDYLIRKTKESRDPRKFWNRLYNRSLLKKIFYPMALKLKNN